MDWNHAPLSELIAHIVQRHHGFLKLELPRLEERLNSLFATHRERDRALSPLPALFFLMKDELDLHMRKEEVLLFPAIQASERAGKLVNTIWAMQAEHDAALEVLSRIRKITSNYAPPVHAGDECTTLFQELAALDRDLGVHMDLENNILFPRALALETATARIPVVSLRRPAVYP